MCRIVGGWEFFGETALFDSIEIMRDTMSAGGPDDFGVYFSPSVSLALGHRRLSIIDLSNFSHQPFISYDKRFVLVFNGEIYNYKTIAQDLRIEGISLKAQSDTEVLLAGLLHWGVECVEHLDGMFAFALWDEVEQKLILCRDRIGVKPLYYFFDSKRFLFASELKALFAYPFINKEINKESLSYFFAYGYIPAPHCILQNCQKLQAGNYLILDSQARIVQKQYYHSKKYFMAQQPYNLQDFKMALHDSVAKRMVSDVSVGVLLSGGVDSSLVCVALKELGYSFETFTMGFHESSFDETYFAKQVADSLNVRNTSFICSLQEAKDLIEKLPFIYDEPFGDTSAIPTLLLSANMRQMVKVALSADGGDELGVGYERYFWAKERWDSYKLWRFLSVEKVLSLLSPEMSLAILQKIGVKIGIDKFLRIKNQLKARSFMEHYQVEITHFRKEELSQNFLLPLASLEDYEFKNPYSSMTCFDFCSYLPDDIMVKTDRASMSVGLEMREPLLGNQFVRFMLSLKMLEKICGKEGKVIYKTYLEQFLSKELIYRPKMGFGIPIESWMRSDLRYLLDDMSGIEGFLDKNFVQKLIKDFDEKRRVDFAKIWYIYTFLAWRKTWRI